MSAQSPVQLHAVLPEGPQPLAVPTDVADLMDLYEGLPVGIYEGMRTFGARTRIRTHDDTSEVGTEVGTGRYSTGREAVENMNQAVIESKSSHYSDGQP